MKREIQIMFVAAIVAALRSGASALTRTTRTLPLIVLVVCLFGAPGTSAEGRTPGFRGLGDLPGGDYFSRALGISGDGTVVVGKSITDFGVGSFRWTLEEGIVGVDTDHTGQYIGSLYGADYSGEVLVGFRGSGYPDYKAFWWTEADGVNELHGSGATRHIAYDVSGDGAVIVGKQLLGNQAFRWTSEGGIVPLGDLEGGDFESAAEAVSADGAVVVGWGVSERGNEAFRWTSETGMVGLDQLAEASYSAAYGVSADGRVVVGSANGAFRWTEATGLSGLGDLSGGPVNSSYATDVSADGSVVVGLADGGKGFDAFVWDEAHGMRDLQVVLAEDLALDLTGWDLWTAEGVSDDGLVIVGHGTNPDGHDEAFIAVLPEPATMIVMALGGLAVLRRRRRAKTLRR